MKRALAGERSGNTFGPQKATLLTPSFEITESIYLPVFGRLMTVAAWGLSEAAANAGLLGVWPR